MWPWLVALAVCATALAIAGCSDDESTASTTTTAPTTTAPTTTTTAPDTGADRPLPVAWVRQVGGAGDDVLNGVTGRDDAVIGAGSTTGLTPATPAPAGSTAAFLDVVAAQDGTARATVQSTQPATAVAGAIASASNADMALTCGTTADTTNEPRGGAGAGGTDGWCAPAGVDGTLGAAAQSGSERGDALLGVAIHSDGREAYAVGRADGLFAGAKDPTGGYLGDGDALVTRVDPSGALRWARQFGTTAPDEATAVTTSDDGDAVATGSTAGRTDGDVGGTLGESDGWIARLDPNGNQRWLTQFGSPGNDRALAVAAGGDPRRGTETFVAVGSTDGVVGPTAGVGGRDATVTAFDASGRMRWALQFGSTGDDEATGVAFDGTTIYVTGTAAAQIVGSTQISLTPTASPDTGGDPSSTTTTTPSTTTTTAPPSGGGQDGFLAAIDATSGTLTWVAQFGSTGDERVTGLSRTGSGLVVVSGSTTGQLTPAPTGGGTDGFMVAFVPPAGAGGAASIV